MGETDISLSLMSRAETSALLIFVVSSPMSQQTLVDIFDNSYSNRGEQERDFSIAFTPRIRWALTIEIGQEDPIFYTIEE